MLERLKQKSLTESASDMFTRVCEPFIESIDEVSGTATIRAIQTKKPENGKTDESDIKTNIVDESINLSLSGLNIVIERSSAVRSVDEAYGQIITESCSQYSRRSFFKSGGILNEATADEGSKIEQIVTDLKKRKLQRCTIVRLDPAKVFQLKVGGKIIGYFYVTDINEGTSDMVNFAQSLKDQLLKIGRAHV